MGEVLSPMKHAAKGKAAVRRGVFTCARRVAAAIAFVAITAVAPAYSQDSGKADAHSALSGLRYLY